MDCPIGTVRSRISRARESIAAKLRPQLDSSSKNFLQKNRVESRNVAVLMRDKISGRLKTII